MMSDEHDASTRLRGGSPERMASSAGHRDTARAAATAGWRPSAGCWRPAPASAPGSRRSWRSAPTSSAPMKQPPIEPSPPMMMTMKTSTMTLVAHRGVHVLAVQRPHHAAEAGERRAGHEHADEQPADAIAERLDHLAVLARRRGSAGRSWCGSAPAACAANTTRPTSTASRRYFSIATSPMMKEPRSAVGSGSG